ncbi:MAG TPA: hypothetical protein VKB14_11775, partial [Actinomycetales bacterium]|nr:hypothetical protein [Actinomycetales bacterium]
MKKQRPSGAGSGAVPAHASGAATSGMAVPRSTAVPDAADVLDAATADPMGAWAALSATARAVADAPLWRCSDEHLVDLLRTLVGDLARIDAARLALIRELDTRGWAAAVGATSTQAWLAQALRVDPRTAAA